MLYLSYTKLMQQLHAAERHCVFEYTHYSFSPKSFAETTIYLTGSWEMNVSMYDHKFSKDH